MASYTIPRSSTSTWVIMGRNQSTMHHNNWVLLLTFLLSLVIIVIVVLIARLFADRLRRRRHANVARTVHVPPLDVRAVDSLPTFVYCSGNDKDGGESQCTVCLCAFEEGKKMKMLPGCKHYFHVKCIDMWLHSHATCPICRAEVKGDGHQLLASPMMPERVGGARGEELLMAGVTVTEGRSMLIMRSSFCRRLSMERGERRADHIMVDFERE